MVFFPASYEVPEHVDSKEGVQRGPLPGGLPWGYADLTATIIITKIDELAVFFIFLIVFSKLVAPLISFSKL